MFRFSLEARNRVGARVTERRRILTGPGAAGVHSFLAETVRHCPCCGMDGPPTLAGTIEKPSLRGVWSETSDPPRVVKIIGEHWYRLSTERCYSTPLIMTLGNGREPVGYKKRFSHPTV
eukprot:766715-Hanusia_phi.AAC.6